MWIAQKIEKLTGSPEKEIKISSLADLAKNLELDQLPSWLKELEKPITVAKSELTSLREDLLWKGNPEILELIGSFLTRTKKEITDGTREAINAFKWWKWAIEKTERRQWLEKIWDQLENDIKEVWNDSEWIVLKQWTKKIKEASQKWVEAVKSWVFFVTLEKTAKQWGILGFFAGIILGILKFLGIWKKVEEVTEKLAPKEIKRIRQEIAQKIQQDLFPQKDKLHPLVLSKLEEIVWDPKKIPEQKLLEIKRVLGENWKLTIKDIKKILSFEEYEDIDKAIRNDKELIWWLKLELEKRVTDTIAKEYWLNLQTEQKRKELTSYIRENLNDSKVDWIDLYHRFKSWETITLWMFSREILSTSWDSFIFMTWLITKWIVSVDDFALNIEEWWINLVSYGLNFWSVVAWWVSIEKLWAYIEWMDKETKTIFLWMLYRKWWAFFNLIWSITSFSTTKLIEAVTPWSIWALEWASSSIKSISSRIEVFGKLEKVLWETFWTEELKRAKTTLWQIQKNNEVIKALRKNWNNLKGLKSAISGIDKKLWSQISNIDNLKDIRSLLSQKVWKAPEIRKVDTPRAYFKRDLLTREIELNRNLQKIIDSQTKAIIWDPKFLRAASKLKEVFAMSEIWKDIQRLTLEAKDSAWVIKKIDALKAVALEAPELLKSIFRWLPEIAVLWLTAATREENESIIEAMSGVAPYLTRLVWPFMMTFSIWSALKDGEVQWMNVTEAWLWVAFLAMDSMTVIKIFWKEWARKWLWEVWKFVIRPITAPADLLVNVYNTWAKVKDFIRTKWSSWWAIKEAWKKTMKKIEDINNKKLAFISAIMIWAWYGIYEIFDKDFDDIFREYIKEGIIEENGEILDYQKLKLKFNELGDIDKLSFIELIFMRYSRVPEDKLELSLKWNELIIKSKDEIVEDWVIEENFEIQADLKLLWINYKFIEFSKS